MIFFNVFLGQVKKAGCLKIVHDKFKKEKKSDPTVLQYLDEFQESVKYNKELEHCKNKFAMVSLIFVLMSKLLDFHYLSNHLNSNISKILTIQFGYN